MSYISKVSISGLKGVQREYTLSRFTYIHGLNRCNKTSIIDAIQLAILGYHPSLPKSNVGIFDMASGNEMGVYLEFSDGSSIRRIYTKNAKGVSHSLTPEDYRPDLRLMPCLDHSLYFGKTESERVQQVINLSQGSHSDALVPKVIASLKQIKKSDHNELDERVLASLLSEIPQHRPGVPIQQWLSSIIDWVKARAKDERARATKFEGGQSVVSEANAIDSLDSTKSLAELQAEISEARRVESAETVLNERAMAEWRNYNEKHLRRKTIESKIKTCPSVEPVAGLQQTIDSLLQQNKDLEAERASTTSLGQAHMSMHAAKMAALSVHQSKKSSALTKIAELSALECCPTCMASSDGWKKQAERYYSAEAAAADLKIAELQAEADTAKAAADSLRPRFLVVKETMAKNNAKIYDLQATIKRSIEAEANLRSLIASLAELGDDYSEPKPQPPLESSALTEARQKVAVIARQIQAAEANEHERRRIAQIAEIALEARTSVEICKLIVEKIQEKQAEIVAESFGPVLEIANQLATGVMPTPIAYLDGRVGRYLSTSGQFVPVAAFSGSEIKLTQVAITVGLARQAENKIAIIDEMGLFDEVSRTRITQNAIELIDKGVIDQIIMVGVTPPSDYISGTSTVIAC